MKQNSSFKWVVLFLLVFTTAMLNFSNMIFASRPVEVMTQFNMTQADLTAISSIGMLPGALFSIVLGNFFDKHERRGVHLVGALLLALGAACQIWRVFADSFPQLIIITFLAGALFLPTQVLPPKFIEAWFPREQMGLAMGVYGAAAGVGITLSFAVGGAIPTTTMALIVVAVGYVLCALLWLACGKMPREDAMTPEQEGAQAAKVSFSAVLKSKNMWFLMLCSGISASSILLLNSYMVNAFLAKGLEPTLASVVAVVFNISLMIGAPLAGSIITKLGRFNIPYIVICVGGGFFLFLTYLVPAGPLTFVFLVLGGIISSGSLSMSMARVGLLPLTGDFGPENIGIAGGMNNTAMGLFAFGLPTIVAMIIGENHLAAFIINFAFFFIIGIVGGVIIPELGENGKLAKKARGEL